MAEKGVQVHAMVIKSSCEAAIYVFNSLISMYLKPGMVLDARAVFDSMELFAEAMDVKNVVSWNVMIGGYLKNDQKAKVVNLFCQMNKNGVKPNNYTYCTILKAHPEISPFQLHAQVVKTNYEKSPTVGTALLDAYIKLGNMEEASRGFEIIKEKNIVAWSAMLAGYAQINHVEGAANLFIEMAKEGIKPIEFTFSSVINACVAPMAAAKQGKQFHAWAIKSKFNNALFVSSALVTMYAKKGNIESANEVFKRQDDRNSVMDIYDLWICTTRSREKGSEGQRHFDMMVKDLGIQPSLDHYSFMFDLYSRAGMLEKTMDVINAMPYLACPTVWRTMLSACHVHRNVKWGKIAVEKLISLQPNDSAAYILLSNICAATGNWQEMSKVRVLMNERNVKKEPAYSWIDVKNKTHSFFAGDVSHPLSATITRNSMICLPG